MDVLTIDVGGSHVKMLATGHDEPRKFVSGPALTPARMVNGVKKLCNEWKYDVVSIGYPGPVLHCKPVAEPHNLDSGWVGFDYEATFERPVKLINDAAMQALGSYQGGKMLFLGLGTGLGTTLIVDGVVEPMEIAHLPYKKATYEDYVGLRGREKYGPKKWRQYVAEVVELLIAALQPDDVVLGGGNVKQLKELPAGCRAGDNANAFLGGYRLWDEAMAHMPSANRKRLECATGRPTRTTVAGSSLTDLPAWKDLNTHYEGVRDLQLRTLFKDDSKRGERMTAEAVGIFLDYSKQRISDETLKLLMQLAEQTGLRARIDAMFRGSIR